MLQDRWLLLLPILVLVVTTVQAMRLNSRLRRSQSELTKELREREQAEAALQESEERYRGLFEHLGLGLFQATIDGRLIRVNRALAAALGYGSPQEMVASVGDVGTEVYTHPDRRAEVLSQVAQSEGPVTLDKTSPQERRELGGRETAPGA